jgi:hypothetical protein
MSKKKQNKVGKTVEQALIDVFVADGNDRKRINSDTPITGNQFMGYQNGRLEHILDRINQRFPSATPDITTGDVDENNSVGQLAQLIEDRGGQA